MRAVVLAVAIGLLAVAGCKRSSGAPQQPRHLKEVMAARFLPTAAALMRDATELVGEPATGRGSGTADELAAARWLEARMAEEGLEAGTSDGFLQAVTGPAGTSHNVIGVLPGQDEKLAGTHLLVGAHIDHLGVDGQGNVFPGADDNASGVAVLLGVVEAWRQSGFASRHTIVFVGFGGEEAGLAGSRHYARQPVRPVGTMMAMINLDMLGRPRFYDYRSMKLAKTVAGIADGPGLGLLVGGSNRLLELSRCAARASKIPSYAPDDFPLLRGLIDKATNNRGDFAPFAELGVPYVFLSTSEHDDYHRVTDTLSTIDPAALRVNAEIVWRTTLALDLEASALSQDAVECPVLNAVR